MTDRIKYRRKDKKQSGQTKIQIVRQKYRNIKGQTEKQIYVKLDRQNYTRTD